MRRGTLFSHRGQKSQTESKVDRPPARLVVVGGVRFDGVDWVVRVGGVGRNRYINQDNQVYQTESKFDRHWPEPVEGLCAVLPANISTGPRPGRSKNDGGWVWLSFSWLATQTIGQLGFSCRPASPGAGRSFVRRGALKNFDRLPAMPIEFGVVRCGGVEWVVRCV
jgi:hypothetical protein